VRKDPLIVPLAPAHLAWIGAVQISTALLFFDIGLSIIPLALFLVATFAAPFIPWLPYFMPVVSRGRSGKRAVSLTFDDGPDPLSTAPLLDLLERHGIKAAFFLTGEKAEKNPELVRSILGRGHLIGNHSYSHDPLLMLRKPERLRKEIAGAQNVFRRFGVSPIAFRPPVGIVSPRLWPVLLYLGMYCLNFRRRSADFGNKRIADLSIRVIKKVRPDDIVLLHDVYPGSPEKMEEWLGEIEKIITELKRSGYAIIPLDSLCMMPVMKPEDGPSGPVASFYDSLSETYDHEQLETGVSMVRKTELRLFAARKEMLIGRESRVLEIGAGTGLFTMDIARMCGSVTAVDMSPGMLGILNAKARKEGIGNIETVTADAEYFSPRGRYDFICSFSTFEYISDLDDLIMKLAVHLSPGGYLYFTTAHSSFIKFFAQIGNAMRQGLWLRARTVRSVRRPLLLAGLNPCFIETHSFKMPFFGGVILEVLAQKPDDESNNRVKFC